MAAEARRQDEIGLLLARDHGGEEETLAHHQGGIGDGHGALGQHRPGLGGEDNAGVGLPELAVGPDRNFGQVAAGEDLVLVGIYPVTRAAEAEKNPAKEAAVDKESEGPAGDEGSKREKAFHDSRTLFP
jgi:hypothetical protein